MRLFFRLLFFFFILSCNKKEKNNENKNLVEDTISKKNDSKSLGFKDAINNGKVHPEESSVEYKDSIVETTKYYIGDVNNDKIEDFATVITSRNKETNDVIHDVINVKFSNDNFEMGFYPSEAIFISKTEDVNKDGSNEIIIFSKTLQGWWSNISVWTFKNGKWEEIGETKGFCSDNEDFKNRVVKINDEYFLIGQDWDLDEKGDFKKIKIRLKS